MRGVWFCSGVYPVHRDPAPNWTRNPLVHAAFPYLDPRRGPSTDGKHARSTSRRGILALGRPSEDTRMGPSGTAADPRRYRSFPDLVRVPLGDGAELVYALDRREARSLSPLAVRLLLGCPTFATLPEHAGRLLRELNAAPGGLPTLLHELSALAAAGLLVSSADLEARARPRSDAAPPPITTVGVPTRDRPDCLRRCLESHLEAARRRGRKVDWI